VRPSRRISPQMQLSAAGAAAIAYTRGAGAERLRRGEAGQGERQRTALQRGAWAVVPRVQLHISEASQAPLPPGRRHQGGGGGEAGGLRRVGGRVQGEQRLAELREPASLPPRDRQQEGRQGGGGGVRAPRASRPVPSACRTPRRGRDEARLRAAAATQARR
jgi:hypothetical protein